MKLDNNILIEIRGGASISGAVLSALIKGVNTIIDLGRSLGTAIKMAITGKKC